MEEYDLASINKRPTSIIQHISMIVKFNLSKILLKALKLAESRRVNLQKISMLDHAYYTATRDIPIDNDSYSEEITIFAWHKYFDNIGVENTRLNRIHAIYFDAVSSILMRDNMIKNVVDFGALCGVTLHKMAKEYPEVCFYGVDRYESIKKLNESNFSGQNIEYVSEDIKQLLCRISDNSLFISMRTMMFLYHHAVDDILEECRKNGIKYVLLLEGVGFSQEVGGFYQFSYEEKKPVIYRGGLIIHNYIGLLARHGYRISDARMIWYNEKTRDMRILKILAEA